VDRRPVGIVPIIIFNGSLHVYHYIDPVTHDYYIKVQWERKGCQADQQHVAHFSIFFGTEAYMCIIIVAQLHNSCTRISAQSFLFLCRTCMCIIFRTQCHTSPICISAIMTQSHMNTPCISAQSFNCLGQLTCVL
jgi:hypothetical protein